MQKNYTLTEMLLKKMKKIKLINLLDGMFMVNKHTTKPITKDVKNWKNKNKPQNNQSKVKLEKILKMH